MSSKNETDVDYVGVVAQLDDRWRVVICRNGIQWIVQERNKKAVEQPTPGCYYAKKFVRTRAGLVSVVRELGLKIDGLLLLPEKVEG